MNRTKKIVPVMGMVALSALLFGFTDMPENHWAASSVQQLVSDGTVSGFEDNTFQPDAPVTRAQFVKMLGVKGDVRNDYLPDLKKSHWAYSNLIHSKLRTVDGKIMPDAEATREQVAVYLYDCYGNNEQALAPSVITQKTDYPKEIGWVYAHGIMAGDDGINLRLRDNLTRAEAAVLIVNSRKQLDHVIDFSDNISQNTLEKVFNDSGLFDSAYKSDAVLTNGEAARAAYRLQLNSINSIYYNDEADFEHTYANDLKAMEPVLGEGRISKEFAEAQAMPEDVFAMFGYAAAAKIQTAAGYGSKDDYYKDAQLSSDTLNAPLTFCYKNGIYPFGGGILKSGTPVTHKTMAAVLLQYDILWGLQSSVTVNYETSKYNDESMRFDNLPENEEIFKGILQNIPNDVYLMPFILSEGVQMQDSVYPVSGYAFYNDLKDAFAQLLAARSTAIYNQYGVKVDFTFYPQLVYDNGTGFTMRTKAQITDAGSNPPSANTLFPDIRDENAVEKGKTFWSEMTLGYMFFMGQ